MQLLILSQMILGFHTFHSYLGQDVGEGNIRRSFTGVDYNISVLKLSFRKVNKM